jgi:cytochrome c oxidase subunit 4
MHGHKTVSSIATYGIVWLVLMVLLLATVLAVEANLDDAVFPGANITLAMVIALIKALVVALWFMHLKDASRLTWVAAGASFVWLALMIIGTAQEYHTRGWTPGGWEAPVSESYTPAHVALEDGASRRPPPGGRLQNAGPNVPLPSGGRGPN